MSPTFVLMTVAEPSLRNQAPKLGSVYPILTVLFAVEPNWAVPATSNLTAGLVVPMPTLPSIINPPVGAAVVSYPLPKLPPPDTLNIDPGAVSPMPTLPPEKIAAGPVEFCWSAEAGGGGGGGGAGGGPRGG